MVDIEAFVDARGGELDIVEDVASVAEGGDVGVGVWEEGERGGVGREDEVGGEVGGVVAG